jgi:hypothetical protein
MRQAQSEPALPPHAANTFESTQTDPDIPGFGSDLVGTRIQIFLPDLSQGNVGNLFDFSAEIIPVALDQPASQAALIVNTAIAEDLYLNGTLAQRKITEECLSLSSVLRCFVHG